MIGLVLKSTGSNYQIKGENGEYYNCKVRGKLKLKGFKTTNPIAVGDHVQFVIEHDHEGVIEHISPRENYVIRKSVHKTEHASIIAANVDQALLICTTVYPRTSLGFIDRFLVTTESFRIPTILVFNKCDILNEGLQEIQNEYISIYENIGIKCLQVSGLLKTGIDLINDTLEGKVSLISGHSGVGKSTLVNELAPGISQSIGEVSDFAEKGIHTTTFAEMFEIKPNTFIIDTPGIKELGLMDIGREELCHFFPEMRELMNDCKFNDCLHVHEPGCAVLEALTKGEISETRFDSYLSMLEGDDNRR